MRIHVINWLRACCLLALLVLPARAGDGDGDAVALRWSKQPDITWTYESTFVTQNGEVKSEQKQSFAITSDSLAEDPATSPPVSLQGPELGRFTALVLTQDSYVVDKPWTVDIPLQSGDIMHVTCVYKGEREENKRTLARVDYSIQREIAKEQKAPGGIETIDLSAFGMKTLEWSMQGWFDFDRKDRCMFSIECELHQVTEFAIDQDGTTEKYETHTRTLATLVKKIDLRGPELIKMIDDAIEECVESLKDIQHKDGYIGEESHKKGYGLGACSLSVLSLLKAGVPKDHPVIVKALNWINKNDEFTHTYSVGLYCMLLEAYYTPDEELRAAAPEHEVNTLDLEPRKLSATHMGMMRKAVKWLIENQSVEGAWSYGANMHSGYDNSNSQYGVLGLYAAARCGIYAPPAEYRKIIKHWFDDQEEKGPEFVRQRKPRGAVAEGDAGSATASQLRGWPYIKEARSQAMSSTQSMTCAGVSSVAIAFACLQKTEKSGARKLRAQAFRSLDDGLAWLESQYGAGAFWGTPYNVYGLERACVLTGTQTFKGHDWYREGALNLCSRPEKTNDSLASRWGNAPDTAFILLFLKRATAPLPAISGED